MSAVEQQLVALTAAATAADEARDAAAGAVARRDALIRAALAAGVSYRALGAATGLSRARLDVIRRGGPR